MTTLSTCPDLVSQLPTGTAAGRADFSEEGSSEEALKHFHGSYGGYNKPSYGGYNGGYNNNYYKPYYNPYNAYNPYTANPYAVYNNPYAVYPYAYNGQIGTITGATSTAGTSTGTTISKLRIR